MGVEIPLPPERLLLGTSQQNEKKRQKESGKPSGFFHFLVPQTGMSVLMIEFNSSLLTVGGTDIPVCSAILIRWRDGE
jgi:hypothetical protein